jgi:hypothetical protein
MACLQVIIQVYKGLMQVYTNQLGISEGSISVVKRKDKDQAAGLEIVESFILCGHHAFKTHIKNTAVIMHDDDQVEVAQGQFTDKGSDVDIIRLESGMSFLQVKVFMTMKEKLRQVRNAICVNKREIANTRLEAVAGADNPFSLITIFRRGHLTIKVGGAVYVTR